MSQTEDHRQATRWMATAAEDLRAADVLRCEGLHAHASFAAHQDAVARVEALALRVLADRLEPRSPVTPRAEAGPRPMRPDTIASGAASRPGSPMPWLASSCTRGCA